MKLVSIVVLFIAVYIFGSLAVDTGRLLFYFLAVVALILSIKYGILFFKGHGNK